jgi:[ribosomal protein S18]-alanine N-acetyltransferase
VAGEGRLEMTRLAGEVDAKWCAHLMATSEPWLTLGRGLEASLRVVSDPDRETWIARRAGRRVGFITLNLKGAFVGYVQSIAVAEEARGQGVGSAILHFAEERIFREHANVFLCVSSFNDGARRLYERLGYRVVGVLEAFLVAGHDEILMRKTRGPILGGPALR